MRECIIPESFIKLPFHTPGTSINTTSKLWETDVPFIEDICKIQLPAPEDTWVLFFSTWDKEKNLIKSGNSRGLVVCWLARFIQLFHYIEGRHVQSITQGLLFLNYHKSSPWNVEERIAFIMENPGHFTRQIEIIKLIEESQYRIKRYISSKE
ncbi:YpoC family protein [Alkalicoccus daliensis]|uniref:YpoC-like domain-containing protein n=1 Tax=Alkalicoccus daliensis TaxID=745820 RepID=A0A1H0ASE0_9BACI|nr:hypothetical protein SAMN04488053_101594 [Alkalicoccus daliensis]